MSNASNSGVLFTDIISDECTPNHIHLLRIIRRTASYLILFSPTCLNSGKKGDRSVLVSSVHSTNSPYDLGQCRTETPPVSRNCTARCHWISVVQQTSSAADAISENHPIKGLKIIQYKPPIVPGARRVKSSHCPCLKLGYLRLHLKCLTETPAVSNKPRRDCYRHPACRCPTVWETLLERRGDLWGGGGQ